MPAGGADIPACSGRGTAMPDGPEGHHGVPGAPSGDGDALRRHRTLLDGAGSDCEGMSRGRDLTHRGDLVEGYADRVGE